MNEQQPYERHMAEKFKQLPLPDVEPNWHQMKVLLEKEMPRRGGYWKWVTAVGILLLMLGGTWFFITQKDVDGLAATKTEKAVNGTDPSAKAPASESNDQQTTSTKQPTEQPLITPSIEKNLHNDAIENPDATQPAEKITGISDVSKNSIPDLQSNRASNTPQRDPVRKGDVNDADAFVNSDPGLFKQRSSETDRTRASKNDLTGVSNSADKTTSAPNRDINAEIVIRQSLVTYNIQNFYSGIPIEKLGPDSISQNYSKAVPEAGKDSKSSKFAKSRSPKPSAIESVEDRKLAFGFSLPMGFPLGDQDPAAYNINAKPNTITDFLPAPQMQYHINNKVYLQTELQLANPQFIQPVLLFQDRTAYPSTNTIHYNSVYARKLYYFNVPVGIHYSPFPHFYLGTGLQFSSLLSGVALREETSMVVGSASSTLISQEYSKFKNDTVADKIDNSEFRLMLDANYYWKQFTVGLRYNQALSNYVNFRLNSVSPLFTDKNKSLQFYLRYNLWEDYKRKKK